MDEAFDPRFFQAPEGKVEFDLDRFLEKCGFEQYKSVFLKNVPSKEAFLKLRMNDLHKLSVRQFSQQKELMSAIRQEQTRLRGDADTPSQRPGSAPAARSGLGLRGSQSASKLPSSGSSLFAPASPMATGWEDRERPRTAPNKFEGFNATGGKRRPQSAKPRVGVTRAPRAAKPEESVRQAAIQNTWKAIQTIKAYRNEDARAEKLKTLRAGTRYEPPHIKKFKQLLAASESEPMLGGATTPPPTSKRTMLSRRSSPPRPKTAPAKRSKPPLGKKSPKAVHPSNAEAKINPGIQNKLNEAEHKQQLMRIKIGKRSKELEQRRMKLDTKLLRFVSMHPDMQVYPADTRSQSGATVASTATNETAPAPRPPWRNTMNVESRSKALEAQQAPHEQFRELQSDAESLSTNLAVRCFVRDLTDPNFSPVRRSPSRSMTSSPQSYYSSPSQSNRGSPTRMSQTGSGLNAIYASNQHRGSTLGDSDGHAFRRATAEPSFGNAAPPPMRRYNSQESLYAAPAGSDFRMRRHGSGLNSIFFAAYCDKVNHNLPSIYIDRRNPGQELTDINNIATGIFGFDMEII